MTKTELIDVFAERHDLTKADAREIVNGFFDAMKEALMDERRVEIRGFGSFTIREYDARQAHNPQTGEKIEIEPKQSVHFNVGKDLKERVDTLNDYDDD
jgi:integration host factor subunit beta